MESVRQFYQIYRDAKNFPALFEVDVRKLREKLERLEVKSIDGIFLGAVLREIGGLVKEFHGGQQQYKIYLMDGSEIKISNPFSCACNRYFIQISSDSFEVAQTLFYAIFKSVKEFFEDGRGESSEVEVTA